MIFLHISIVMAASLLGASSDLSNEQALRAIKGLTDARTQELAGACLEPGGVGGPYDLYHEDLALRVAFLFDESAQIALRLSSDRGRDSAAYMFAEAAKYRLLAYACHSLRPHLEHAAKLIGEALNVSKGSPVSLAVRSRIEEIELEVARLREAHEIEAEWRMGTFMSTKALPEVPPPPSRRAKPSRQVRAPRDASARAEENPTPSRSEADKVALAVSGSMTGIFLGASLGMGLSRLREPFEGLAHRAIYDAAVASWSGGARVPYGQGVDMCQQGRELADAGVIRACDNYDRLGKATVATGVLGGVSLATSIIFAVRIVRARSRRVRLNAGWQPGGMTVNLSGRF